MRPHYAAVVLAASLAGCQHIELRNHTLRQVSTLSDLQHRQVLDNIASFSENPNSLPYFAIVATGTTNITNSVNAGGSFNWDKLTNAGRFLPFQFDKAGLTIGGTNTAGEQWGTASILNPDELLLMRCVYQMAVGAATCDCDCAARVKAYFERTPCYLEAIRPGWYCVGRRMDVPREAAYVGHHGHTYVWVMPDGVDYLTRFTLAILDIATAVKPGDVGRVNLKAERIKQLTEKAKDLTAILDKYPKPAQGQSPGPIFDKLKKELDETLDLLDALYNGYTPEDVLAGVRQVPSPSGGMRTMEVFPRLPKDRNNEQRRELADKLRDLMEPPSGAPGGPRERKNFFNPFQQNIIPQTIPQVIPQNIP